MKTKAFFFSILAFAARTTENIKARCSLLRNSSATPILKASVAIMYLLLKQFFINRCIEIQITISNRYKTVQFLIDTSNLKHFSFPKCV